MVLKQSSIVNRNDFLINCPACGRMCKIKPEEVGNSDRIVKIYGMKGLFIYQCGCGNRFNVKLDFRRKPRHECNMSSFYITLTMSSYGKRPNVTGEVPYSRTINSVIKNISVEGIGLLTHGRQDIKPEDELLITFMLKRGDKERLLERRVIVRVVRDNYIGAEFFPGDKNKPEIGFFLMED